MAGRVAVADAGVRAVGRVRHGVQGGLACEEALIGREGVARLLRGHIVCRAVRVAEGKAGFRLHAEAHQRADEPRAVRTDKAAVLCRVDAEGTQRHKDLRDRFRG